jgi:hypothetical protein
MPMRIDLGLDGMVLIWYSVGCIFISFPSEKITQKPRFLFTFNADTHVCLAYREWDVAIQKIILFVKL